MQREELWQAVQQQGPLMSDQVSFAPEEAQLVSLLRALRNAGIAEQELHALCRMHARPADVRMRLRAVRGQLLARLHAQQQVLNELDNVVASIRSE